MLIKIKSLKGVSLSNSSTTNICYIPTAHFLFTDLLYFSERAGKVGILIIIMVIYQFYQQTSHFMPFTNICI